MKILPIIWAALAPLFAFAAMLVTQRRGRGNWLGFALGLIGGPIGLAVAFFLPRRSGQRAASGVLYPGKLLWLRTLLWMIALFAALVVVGSVVSGGGIALGLVLAGLPQMAPADAPHAITLIAITIGSLAVIGGYALAVRIFEKRGLPELALDRLAPEWLIGVGIGALLMTLTVGALWATGWAKVSHQPVTAIVEALQNTIQSSIMEETIARLVVFRLVWRACGVWPALIFSAALFGGLHLANPNATVFATICIALEAGILLAAFYILTGRAWVSIGVHAGWNFTQGWIWGAAVSGTEGFRGGPFTTAATPGVPDWLSGGGFGPEASLPGLAICTAAGLWMLHRAWQRGLLTRMPVEA